MKHFSGVLIFLYGRKGIRRMFPADEPAGPENPRNVIVFESHPVLFGVFPKGRKIAPLVPFSAIGFDNLKIIGHVGPVTEQINRRTAVPGMVMIFLYKAARRNRLPLPLLI